VLNCFLRQARGASRCMKRDQSPSMMSAVFMVMMSYVSSSCFCSKSLPIVRLIFSTELVFNYEQRIIIILVSVR
jgi:hypothetical protein